MDANVVWLARWVAHKRGFRVHEVALQKDGHLVLYFSAEGGEIPDWMLRTVTELHLDGAVLAVEFKHQVELLADHGRRHAFFAVTGTWLGLHAEVPALWFEEDLVRVPAFAS